MKMAVFAALAFYHAIGCAQAQTFSADDLNNRTIHRRAVEAVIWGMPAVNFDLVAKWLDSFKEFPVRQKPASFNLDEVMAKMTPKN
jgi:hypothetical protein